MSNDSEQAPEDRPDETWRARLAHRIGRRDLIAAGAGFVLGAVVVLAGVGLVSVITSGSGSFEAALEECGLEQGDSVRVLDGGDGLNLQTARTVNIDGFRLENSDGVPVEDAECVLRALDVPDVVLSEIESTRALDGRMSAERDDVSATWSFHPDDGLDLALTRE
ncbi:hypothetical protein RIF23_10295 [Lipingzhangella sp. LS1_29]|uniref:Uncharacterized protein n=1 Tax=Lipingzhangella rawalii TaxID=2055835 RepID=A0ABU2H5W4_9ACTN|nr:hypothetical protein [Lipingzhangella rawalii]MDS1270688.1 hypothetical protein [Lipingzhangella rawalii]